MNHPEPHDLTALAYNMVEGPERRQLLEHVHLCDACRELYDSYLEEQALVRDTLYRDARSGPAEARALERTLAALAALEEPPARGAGRLFRLVTWRVVAGAAAGLALALGLLVVLNPPPAQNNVIAIAPEQQAPGRVVEGELMVPASGQWQRADAVPANEWVLSSGSAPLKLSFPGGAQASLDPQSVFRIALEEGETQPVLYVLHGNGLYEAGDRPDLLCVRWRDGEFVPMAGAQIAFDASYGENWRPDAAALRGWMAARHMNVRVNDGKGVFLPVRPGMLPGVLVAGEGLEQGPDRARVLRTGDGRIEIMLELFADNHDARREIEELTLRLDDLRTGSRQFDDELRRRLERSWALPPVESDRRQVVIKTSGRKAVSQATVTSAENGLRLEVTVHDGRWDVRVSRRAADGTTTTSSHNGTDPNALRAALAEDARRLFDEAAANLRQNR
jgi:hypothetical protein